MIKAQNSDRNLVNFIKRNSLSSDLKNRTADKGTLLFRCSSLNYTKKIAGSNILNRNNHFEVILSISSNMIPNDDCLNENQVQIQN
jgi:hypothetical protein